MKLLWLAICNIEDKRARERAKAREKGQPLKGKDTTRHLIEGATTIGWKPALQALAIAYPDRLTTNIK
jgi:putative transposase